MAQRPVKIMRVLLALDVSQTSTGYSFWDLDACDWEPFSVGAVRPPKGYKGLDRYRYILSALERLTQEKAGGSPAVVIFEGYPFFLFGQQKVAPKRGGKPQWKTTRTDQGQGPGNQVFGIAGITEMIKMKVHFQWKCPFACFSPTTIKKYATGNGRAQKKEMIACLFEEYGLEFRTDDEVDSYWIGELAMMVWHICDGESISLKDIERRHQREAIAAVINGNNPEGTLNWLTLNYHDQKFGRKKTRKK